MARIQAQLRTREFSEGMRPGPPGGVAQQPAAAHQQQPRATPVGGRSSYVGMERTASTPAPGEAVAAPKLAPASRSSEELQQTIGQLQKQLLQAQQQLAALAAAAGSPAALAVVTSAAAGGALEASGSGSLESGSPERTSAEVPSTEPPQQPAQDVCAAADGALRDEATRLSAGSV